MHAAIGRSLSADLGSKGNKEPALLRDDFQQAMENFLPVAMRDITKPATEGGRSGWDDVGGLNDIRNAIEEVHLLLIVSVAFRLKLFVSDVVLYFFFSDD